MNLPFRRFAVAFVALSLTAGAAAAQEKSLYHRLGGYDAIAAMLDEFVGRLATEQQLQRFFAGHSKNSEMRQRQLVLDLFCQVTGGPCFYIGRDLKVAHAVGEAPYARARVARQARTADARSMRAASQNGAPARWPPPASIA
jgi:truncated hemoglobin YjbI